MSRGKMLGRVGMCPCCWEGAPRGTARSQEDRQWRREAEAELTADADGGTRAEASGRGRNEHTSEVSTYPQTLKSPYSASQVDITTFAEERRKERADHWAAIDASTPQTTVRTTGTQVRWEDDNGWTEWLNCWEADIEDGCLRIVTKNTFTQWVDPRGPMWFDDEDNTERDDEVTRVPLHSIPGRIEIRYGTGEAL